MSSNFSKTMHNNSLNKCEFLDDAYLKETGKIPANKKRKMNKEIPEYDPARYAIHFDDIVKENLDPANMSISTVSEEGDNLNKSLTDEFIIDETISEDDDDVDDVDTSGVQLKVEVLTDGSIPPKPPTVQESEGTPSTTDENIVKLAKNWRATHRAVLDIKHMMDSRQFQNVAGPSSGPSCSSINQINWPIRDNTELIRLENGIRAGDEAIKKSVITLFQSVGTNGSAKDFINAILKNLFKNARYTWTGKPPNNYKNAPPSHAARDLRIVEILRDLTITTFPNCNQESVEKLIKICLYNKNDLDRKNAAKRMKEEMLARAVQDEDD